MRILFFLFCIVCFCNCSPSKSPKEKKENAVKVKTESPNWLLGNWKRVGEKEGQQTYENWTLVQPDKYKGVGCTVKGKDTIWREDIVLEKEADIWAFKVKTQGETTATHFKVTKLTPTSFICENPENEFPKKIEYRFDGQNIQAEISGGGPTIPFNFVRMKNEEN
ncbi:MAG: DUF6265 family protein [Saprospiraceae bacterium]|nr:DUF6265 family protein [Saprospiraceae bacterium]